MELLTKIGLGTLLGLGVYLAVRDGEAAPPPAPGGGLPGGLPGGAPLPGPAGTALQGTLLQTVGKHWILTNRIANGLRAANYGWHFRGAAFGGSKFEASVSLPNVRVIQGVGTAHDRAHTDYSQTCVLASQSCRYQGQDARLSDLLVDPVASKLLSVEGPLLITRQPGVAVLEPITIPPASTGIAREQVAALPDNIPQREAQLLAWVEQGYAEYEWIDIQTGDLVFHVFADALRFGGVRVNASATLLQQIADRLDCSLLTARMADLVFASANRVILPIPKQAGAQMASTAYMVQESDAIDAAAVKVA